MKKITPTSAIKTLGRFTSNDDPHAIRRHVRVENSRLWATNGHRAMILTREALSDDLPIGSYLPNGSQDTDARPAPPIDQVLPKPVDPSIFIPAGQWKVLKETLGQFTRKAFPILHVSPDRTWVELRHNRGQIEVNGPKIATEHRFAVSLQFLVEACAAINPTGNVKIQQGTPQSNYRHLTALRIDANPWIAVVMPVRY